jgi:hypothetical protein
MFYEYKEIIIQIFASLSYNKQSVTEVCGRMLTTDYVKRQDNFSYKLASMCQNTTNHIEKWSTRSVLMISYTYKNMFYDTES